MLFYSIFLAILISAATAEQKCGTGQWHWPRDFKLFSTQWHWPRDFKLLSSKDDLWEFFGYNCWTYRDKTVLQNGKYFCWKKKETLPPIRFRGIWEDDHGDKCTPMYEPADVLYNVKGFCTSFQLSEKFKVQWSFNNPFGFDKKKCIRFNRLSLIGDIWFFNYMCGENIVFEEKYCIDV